MLEQNIETNLIRKLADGNKYIYREDIHDRNGLEQNFRRHFEELNSVRLTDSEFSCLKQEIITADVFAASAILREDNRYFERDDGTPLYYNLLNTKDWCKNNFEVIHQLRMNTENSHQRYDVILLMNGIPVAQIELKNYPVNPRRAMEQIINYRNEPGNGYGNSLLCFLQIFIVSNGEATYYFSNNNNEFFKFKTDDRFLPVYQFADRDNEKITNLDQFAETFLGKCALGKMIGRYMVLVQSEKRLMIMRPYQIYAVQEIVKTIHENNGNGYIWHTTGSGKTLTSFKTSTLLKENSDIYKCLFVVDRKDLDQQTREEFNKFQEGCVEENTNTYALVQRLLSDDYRDKVIVTTFQKLGLALSEDGKSSYRDKLAPLADKRIAFIFDECHRSQFGDNHQRIKEFFPQAQMFGFTGTPIFDENSNHVRRTGEQAQFETTDEVFQKEMHSYTITHAIEDQNVLKFRIEHFQMDGNPSEKQRKEEIAKAILDKHNAATAERKFNALFATNSINDAIAYYKLFREIQEQRLQDEENYAPLNIACVFSPPADGTNPDVKQLQEDLDTEREDNKLHPEEKKRALNQIITAYNTRYGQNCRIEEFDAYYRDVQKRIKNQQYVNADLPQSQKIDITIVVDMLLTGFDSKFLNTLYVDKKLRWHNLIQAFSRTNRVLDDTKPAGNIIDFRAQKDAVDEAIKLFSGVDSAEKGKEIWLVEAAPKVMEKLAEAVAQLNDFMKSQGLAPEPSEVTNLKGDKARCDFIEKFKQVQKLRNRLDQYTDLEPEQEKEIEQLLPKDRLAGFRTQYLETAKRLQTERNKPEAQVEPEVENADFELTLFSSAIIDYDYIMNLLARSSGESERVKATRDELIRLIMADAKFMDEGQDLARYIEKLPTDTKLTEQEIKEGYQRFKQAEQDKELAAIADKHNVPLSALRSFVEEVALRKIFDGEDLDSLYEGQNLGWKERGAKQKALAQDLKPYLLKQVKDAEISGLSAWA